MTAVDWFVQEINKLNVSTEAKIFINKLKNQANEMEKNQNYSEEEVKNIIFKFTNDFDMKKNIEITSKEQNKWFEQFSKLKNN